ncbi:MAG: polysaccharide deacetylase family protein [Saprospiraceae bacterium]|nr:polysaccharide deacetylase family protein [Saprospiraceae bacterium]
MNKVLVYAPRPENRLTYVLKQMGTYFSELHFEICSSIETYQKWEGMSVQHGSEQLKSREIRISNDNSFLWTFDKIIADKEKLISKIPYCIFPDPSTDWLSGIFWHLSRIEEYEPRQKDKHGRFPATASLLFKNNVLRLPLVDHWVFQFAKKLEQCYHTNIKLKPADEPFSIGFDIDQFYKHKYKSWIKILGGTLRELSHGELTNVSERLKIYFGIRKDPFDSYEYIRQLNLDKEILYFFILAGGESPYDNNHRLNLKPVRKILEELQEFGVIGIHPSYKSFNQREIINNEIKRLQDKCRQPVVKSRQHYLKFTLPETYRFLIDCDIREDYSMAYPEMPGFRASSCRSFYWFDLEKNSETNLKIVPGTAMDRSYLSYLNYSPQRTLEDLTELWQITQKYKGHFHLIWHNSSFDFKGEWKGWEDLLKNFIRETKSGY